MYNFILVIIVLLLLLLRFAMSFCIRWRASKVDTPKPHFLTPVSASRHDVSNKHSLYEHLYCFIVMSWRIAGSNTLTDNTNMDHSCFYLSRWFDIHHPSYIIGILIWSSLNTRISISTHISVNWTCAELNYCIWSSWPTRTVRGFAHLKHSSGSLGIWGWGGY